MTARKTPTRSERRARTRPRAAPSALELSDDAFERCIGSGEKAGLLEAYLGEAQYHELCEMSREASARSVRGGPRVLVLPGILGSKIGLKRKVAPDDVLWIDLFDIAFGDLRKLALGRASSRYEALGVLLIFYLKLKLSLRIAGYDVDFHPFDWRYSSAKLGDELAARVQRERADEVFLVAHSMGGLVARAALATGLPKAKRLVMLGTPNFGCFAPVQAFRGVYPTLREVAWMDQRHSAEELVEQVFITFPSLYELLPSPERFSGIDLYDTGSWPTTGPRPLQSLLDAAVPVQKTWAKADERFFLIAGVGQPTVTGVSKDGAGNFEYERSLAGDGTVPLALARLPDAKTYYVEESHGNLPNNGHVERAVAELIDAGTTSVLPEQWAPRRRGALDTISDDALRTEPFEGRPPEDLHRDERRRLLQALVAPGARDRGAAAALPASAPEGFAGGYAHEFDHITIGRRMQRRIEVRLAHGNLVRADSEAYVVGLYRDVDPGGAALDLDARLDGAILDFARRRVFTGDVGEVFILPTGRHELRSQMVAFIGLGPVDFYDDQVQAVAAENLVRTFVRAKVDDFATVLFGSRPGPGPARSLRNLMHGFLRALRDEDHDQSFRRVTFCIRNPETYREAKQELYRLVSTELFEDIEVTIDEKELGEPVAVLERATRFPSEREPVYLIVRLESSRGARYRYRSAVLPSGGKATVMTGEQEVSRQKLDHHLDAIERSGFEPEKFGSELASMLLADEVRSVLERFRECHFTVVHDAAASRIPWETLRIAGWSPAVEAGLSRRYMATDLSPAKWLRERVQDPTLHVLLVVNPTEDLAGAEREGKRVQEALADVASAQVDVMRGKSATRAALLRAFTSGAYDVIHYAGHAYFDRDHVARSGILCHRDEVLSGADLASISNLPSLAVFNACEAARVRRRKPKPRETHNGRDRIKRNVSFAEAFLRGGIANYLGTYWPVGDEAALEFAKTFYAELIRGARLGDAILQGRRRVLALGSIDWADYVHYGSYDFQLKMR